MLSFQSKMGDGAQTLPRRTRKVSVLDPVSKIVPHVLRKQSTVVHHVSLEDQEVCTAQLQGGESVCRNAVGISRTLRCLALLIHARGKVKK